ncbi:hypothetical protein MBM09_13175 [Flaviramulus sp. BrNp1-15]|uniref:DUF6580 family putative transport protein n=1 Tax=Flaviramulus sp. BrNp1-15 TaxID=2916754 RepID=UPI001EE82B11|nr:DUF6580 family putative transport protein [Flaviramulus sp. BrNp1-15]ULC58858.1 hypothetical protein MBM09_13175 [Flaviramulus sp. BrNp1-15]
MNSLSKKQIVIILFIAIAAIFRLLPHLPNVTPVTAMALFSGVYFTDKKFAFIIPIFAMLISDIFLGFSTISIFVYLAFILVGFIGIKSKKMSITTVLISSISFFIITNFGVWLLAYPKTVNGLLECYTLAIPFFRNSLIGDFFFAAVMYFSFNFVSKKYLKTA